MSIPSELIPITFAGFLKFSMMMPFFLTKNRQPHPKHTQPQSHQQPKCGPPTCPSQNRIYNLSICQNKSAINPTVHQQKCNRKPHMLPLPQIFIPKTINKQEREREKMPSEHPPFHNKTLFLDFCPFIRTQN